MTDYTHHFYIERICGKPPIKTISPLTFESGVMFSFINYFSKYWMLVTVPSRKMNTSFMFPFS